MTRGNLGVDGEVKLAEMAALPPFAQVIADMGGFRFGGWCDRLHAHGENLPWPFRGFHYLPGQTAHFAYTKTPTVDPTNPGKTSPDDRGNRAIYHSNAITTWGVSDKGEVKHVYA